MGFFKEFGLGIRTYSRAWKFIKEHKLWGYLFLPGTINLIIFIGLAILGYIYSGILNDKLTNWFSIETDWLKTLMYWTTFIMVRLATSLLFYYTYRYLMLIFLSPALAILAEKVMEIQTGIKRPFVFKQFLKDVLRGIMLAIRNLAVELMILFIIFLIGFIPVIGFIAPFLSFFVSAYYYGFSMMDYRNELKQMSVKESIIMIKKHKGIAYGNGTVFSFCMFIPFFGAMIAPILALVAAQLAISDIEEQDRLKLQAKKDQPIPI